MKTLLIPCLIAAATTAASAQTRPPERVIREEGALVITDGASYYRFRSDSSFDSGPIGLSGRTITGRWRGDEGEFTVEGRWGWINGVSPIDDFRRMTMRIGGIDGPGTIQSLPLSGVVTSVRVHRPYHIIDDMVRIPPPADSARAAREAADRFVRETKRLPPPKGGGFARMRAPGH